MGGTGSWDLSALNWNTAADGSGAFSPWSNGSAAVFGTSAGAVTLNTGVSASSVTFDVGAYTISGTGSIGIGGTVSAAAGTGTIGVNLAGVAGLNKSGAGQINLTSANSFLGAVTLAGGTLGFLNDNQLGFVPGYVQLDHVVANGGALSQAGGTATINRGIRVNAGGLTSNLGGSASGIIFNQPISGTGAWAMQFNNGTAAFNADSGGYSGAVTTSNAAATNTTNITVGADNPLGVGNVTMNTNGGTVIFRGSGSESYTVPNDISFTGAGTIDFGINSGNTVVFAGAISGSTAIFKGRNGGTGTAVLSGSSPYTGTTTVHNGTLMVAGNVPVSTNSPLGNSAANINLRQENSTGATALMIGGPYTISRGVTGTTAATVGTLVFLGGNTPNPSTFAGPISLSTTAAVGTLYLSQSPGGTVTFSNNITGMSSMGIVYVTGNGTTTAGGTNANPLNLGAAVFSGTGNTYSGITRVGSGTLTLTTASGLGAAAGGIAVQTNGAVLVLDPGANTTFTETSQSFFTGRGILGQGALINRSGNNTWSSAMTVSDTTGSTVNVVTGTTLTLGTGLQFLTSSESASPVDFVKIGGGAFVVQAFSTTVGNRFRGGLTVNAGTLDIRNASQSGILAGFGTFTANDGGVIRLTGSVGTGSLSPGYNLNRGGRIVLDNAFTSNNNNRLNDASPVTLNGGELAITGGSAAASSEVYGSLNVASGANTVTLSPNAGFQTNLGASGGMVRSVGATVLFRGPNLGATPAAGVGNATFSSGLGLVGGGGADGSTSISILPFATADLSATGTGTDFVTSTGGTRVRPLTAAEYTASITDGATVLDNVKLAAGIALATPTTINSLILGNGVSVSGAGVLTVNSGAVFFPSTATGASVSVSGLNFGSTEGIITNNVDTTLSSAITGSNGLTKSGSGALTLSGAVNNFSGPFTVASGTLLYSTEQNLGDVSSVLRLNGGVLTAPAGATSLSSGKSLAVGTAGGTISVQTSNTLTVGGVIGPVGSQVGSLTKIGAGTLVLDGVNTFGGNGAGVDVRGGILVVGADENLGVTANTLNIFGSSTLVLEDGASLSAARGVAVGSAAVIEVPGSSSTATIAGNITNAFGELGTLAKTGDGTLILSGTNSYGSKTSVLGGTLAWPNLSPTPASIGYLISDNFVFNNGTLAMTQSGGGFAMSVFRGFQLTNTVGFNITEATGTFGIGGPLSGSGVLRKHGPGLLSLTNPAGTYAGKVEVLGGQLNISHDRSLGAVPGSYTADALTLSGTTLASNAGTAPSIAANRGITLVGGGTLTATTGTTFTIASKITGGGPLNKNGSGTLVLVGSSDFTGALNLNAGTAHIAVNNALPVGTAVNIGNAGVTALNLADRFGVPFDQTVAGIGAADAAGIITANADLLGSRAVLTVNSVSPSVYQGVLSGHLSLQKQGNSSLELTGNANSYTGTTTVSAGALRVSNTAGSATGAGAVNVTGTGQLAGEGIVSGPVTISLGGTLAPGNSAGDISTGPLTLGTVASPAAIYSLDVDVDANSADFTDVTGGVSLDKVDVAFTFTAITGLPGTKTFIVIRNDAADAVSTTGDTFANVSGLIPQIISYSFNYAYAGTDARGLLGDGNDVALTVSYVPEPAAVGVLAVAGVLTLRRRSRPRG